MCGGGKPVAGRPFVSARFQNSATSARRLVAAAVPVVAVVLAVLVAVPEACPAAMMVVFTLTDVTLVAAVPVVAVMPAVLNLGHVAAGCRALRRRAGRSGLGRAHHQRNRQRNAGQCNRGCASEVTHFKFAHLAPFLLRDLP